VRPLPAELQRCESCESFDREIAASNPLTHATLSHTPVLLYCWHAYHNRIGPGLYFASANYLVHSVMYTYYFLNAAKLHWLARPCAPFITTMQIVQMMVCPLSPHSLSGTI
jgi:hypothetical protein